MPTRAERKRLLAHLDAQEAGRIDAKNINRPKVKAAREELEALDRAEAAKDRAHRDRKRVAEPPEP